MKLKRIYDGVFEVNKPFSRVYYSPLNFSVISFKKILQARLKKLMQEYQGGDLIHHQPYQSTRSKAASDGVDRSRHPWAGQVRFFR